jgi:hypothetical protein
MKRLLLGAVLAVGLSSMCQLTVTAGPSPNGPDCPPTQSVPEPTSCLAAVATLGFGWALRKHLR